MRHTTLGPAVKTSDPGSAPRGAGRAVGGIRAQGKNPGRRASSPSTLLPSRPFVCADPKNSARTRSPAPASADSLQRPSPFATELARRGIIERDPPHEETAPRIGISTHHELPRAIESAGTDDLGQRPPLTQRPRRCCILPVERESTFGGADSRIGTPPATPTRSATAARLPRRCSLWRRRPGGRRLSRSSWIFGGDGPCV